MGTHEVLRNAGGGDVPNIGEGSSAEAASGDAGAQVLAALDEALGFVDIASLEIAIPAEQSGLITDAGGAIDA